MLLWGGLALLIAFRLVTAPAIPPANQPLAEGSYQVLRVVDGDTLEIEDGYTIRLMGVDTPETVKPESPVEPWGPEASAFARDFVAAGEVRLTFDRERVDRYGRMLSYAWVGERMLNEELVRAGLAEYEPQFQYAAEMKQRFRAAQDEAKLAKRGLWSE